jgi:hypothetical protein
LPFASNLLSNNPQTNLRQHPVVSNEALPDKESNAPDVFIKSLRPQQR